jgi:hypothetical protein
MRITTILFLARRLRRQPPPQDGELCHPGPDFLNLRKVRKRAERHPSFRSRLVADLVRQAAPGHHAMVAKKTIHAWG